MLMLLTAGLMAFQTTSKHEGKLEGKRIAILAADGVEYSELTEPRKALNAAGATTVLISPETGKVKSWKDGNWFESLPVDLELSKAKPTDFNALVLPGGVMNPDKLRMNQEAVRFVRAFHEADKPVAAICHGPWLLVEAELVRGRQITSWPSLKKDIQNSGGIWIDVPVVADRGIITSRKPDDLPLFNAKMIEVFAAATPAKTSIR